MKSILSILTLPMAFLFLVGCSKLADNSLLTDEKIDSFSNAVNKDPLATEVFISVDSTNLILSSATSSLELTGSCYTSTYPNNNIQVLDTKGNILAVMDLKTGTASPKCRDGRFDLVISPNSLNAGSNDLHIQMPVIDASGVTNLNQGNAVRYFRVIK